MLTEKQKFLGNEYDEVEIFKEIFRDLEELGKKVNKAGLYLIVTVF